MTALSAPPRPLNARIDGESLIIDWAEGVRQSRHDLGWLMNWAARPGHSDQARLPQHLWRADPTLKSIEQVTARFHGMVALDTAFEDVSITEDEGRRLAGLLGGKAVLIMGNHGIIVAGPDVPAGL